MEGRVELDVSDSGLVDDGLAGCCSIVTAQGAPAFAQLTSLNLTGAKITSLPENLFNLPLKSLNIGSCKKLPLDVIDTICQKMPLLESLGLGGLEMTDRFLCADGGTYEPPSGFFSPFSTKCSRCKQARKQHR